MPATVTVQLVVPAGYAPGDYLQLHGDGGDGSIDWNTPVSNRSYDLFPGGAGIYGFGIAPFGRHRFGSSHSMSAPGFGRLPFGRFPFGHGTAVITARHRVLTCDTYKFAFAAYDAAGNQHTGTPGEVSVNVQIPPDAPTGLKKNSYNKTTDVLTLDAA